MFLMSKFYIISKMAINLELSLLLMVTSVSVISISYGGVYPEYKDGKSIPFNINEDALFLTPYLEKGRISEAQKLATVPTMLHNIESFAGFLTVNKTCNSNLFFWLFKSQHGQWEERSLIVWLQGGIGSSLIGLFENVGPFFINNDQLKRRKYSWHQKYNLVFVDKPVGFGFSFTEKESGYARNIADAAHDLYEVLVQLHVLFPSVGRNELVIVGESYGAKYAVATAHRIYKMNQVSTLKMNLSRLILACAYVDPVSMTTRSSYLYKLGLVDEKQLQKLTTREEELRASIRAGDFLTAVKHFDEEQKEILKLTGFKGAINYVDDMMGWNSSGSVVWFTNQPGSRKALHVGSYNLSDGLGALVYMRGDALHSVKGLVEELLRTEVFPVMFIGGQVDIISAYPMLLDFYNSLQWPYAKEYHEAKRCHFRVGNDVAGYYKTAGTFTEVLLRNSGHFIAAARPKWAFELVDRFIENHTLFQCL